MHSFDFNSRICDTGDDFPNLSDGVTHEYLTRKARRCYVKGAEIELASVIVWFERSVVIAEGLELGEGDLFC